MNPGSSDRLLKSLFRRLREREELSTPPFARVLDRRVRPGQSTSRRSLGLGLAAAAACAVVVLIALFPHGRPASEEEFSRVLQSADPIAVWKEPTELLLEPPDPGLLRGVPVIGDTSFNITAQ
jgi:hypothetical protein